MYKMQVRFMIF